MSGRLHRVIRAAGLASSMLAMFVGCATSGGSGAPTSAQQRVDATIRNGPVAGKLTAYDASSGTCTPGAVQMTSRAEYDALVASWKGGAACTAAKKSQLPSTTGYPAAFAKLQRSGQANVLVRLEATGAVESVHAVCATDAAFGEAAVETATAIRFEPARCDGVPTKSAFLLPLDYAF